MAYSKRIPPIKIFLNVEEFNKLVDVLNTMSTCNEEKLEKKSIKLKDKLLRYSVPITNENEEQMVDIRFYNNEITDLFYILFFGIENMIDVETNYFEVLLKVREKIKEEKMENE
ncbi:MAG: hypothetical protein IKR57_00475 [Bacilli bacterium]|nr:hypothetical protein [Bacilli bacterium]MBR4177804.1 hypothetical protein [Bacilli bacterium]